MAVSVKVSREEWAAELYDLGRAFRRTFRSLSRLRGRDTHLGVGELSHAQCELLFESRSTASSPPASSPARRS